jgi:hypothetical protein
LERIAVYECDMIQTMLPFLSRLHGVFPFRQKMAEPSADSAEPHGSLIIMLFMIPWQLSENAEKAFQLVNAVDCENQKEFSLYSYSPDVTKSDDVV